MLDLLRTLKDGRTWQQVSDVLGNIYSGAFLRLVLLGERHAPLNLVNTVRAHFNLEPLTETPADAVAASGVDRVVKLSKRPNTAFLAAVSGDVCRVIIKTGELPVGDAPSVSVTLGYVAPERRKGRHGRKILLLSELDAHGLETVRGKSGNLAAITATGGRAALVCEPSLLEFEEWLSTL